METKHLSELTDEELLIEKKKLKNSKVFHATLIGFLAGILLFGTIAWALNSERQLGFLIPMLIPIALIYRLLKNPKRNQELEALLKERSLD